MLMRTGGANAVLWKRLGSSAIAEQGNQTVRFWRRVMAKGAMTAFVLLFALQAIAAPGLCAVHDRTSTPAESADGVSPARPTQLDGTAFTPRPDVRAFDQSGHEDNELDRCDGPVLLAADTHVPVADSPSIVLYMAQAWQRATLSSGSALPGRRARLTRPSAQSFPLEYAPRLRI
jgi:hypothetical protein